jgi:hypothetical protein
MFIGHFGVGFAAKRAAPEVSLGALFAACQLADLLWPTLVLLGVEQLRIAPGITRVTPLDFVSYPYSHSLATLCVYGLALGIACAASARRPRSTRSVAVVAAVVVSHWILDVVTHRPDVPIMPGGTARLGFGLWNSLAATVIVESAIFFGGLAIYIRATAGAARRRGVLWSLVGLLLIIYVVNLASPPPPSPSAVAWGAEALWLLVAFGWWADRSRSVDGKPQPESRRVYQ